MFERVAALQGVRGKPVLLGRIRAEVEVALGVEEEEVEVEDEEVAGQDQRRGGHMAQGRSAEEVDAGEARVSAGALAQALAMDHSGAQVVRQHHPLHQQQARLRPQGPPHPSGQKARQTPPPMGAAQVPTGPCHRQVPLVALH